MAFLISATLFTLTIIGSESLDVNFTNRQNLKHDQAKKAIQINFSNSSVVKEVQHTICSIKTEEVVAKAQATASRILTGVCTSDEMNKAFRSMEKTFLDKLDELQQNVITIIQSKLYPPAQKGHYKISKLLSPFKTIQYFFDESRFKNYN